MDDTKNHKKWLLILDGKMDKPRRKILLFFDMAASHPSDPNLIQVKIIFLSIDMKTEMFAKCRHFATRKRGIHLEASTC